MTSQPKPRGRPKTGRKVVAQVPLDPAKMDRVKALAEDQGRPVADVLRDAVDEYLQKRAQ